MKTIDIKTKDKEDVVEITGFIQDFIKENKVKDGKVAAFVEKPGVALTTVDKKPTGAASKIIKSLLDRGSGTKGKHYDAPQSIKMMAIGTAALIIRIENGKFANTPFDVFLLCDLDGPRTITLSIKTA